MSIQARVLEQLLQLNKRFWQNIGTVDAAVIAEREQKLCRWVPRVPDWVKVDRLGVEGIPVFRISTSCAIANRNLLYLHGGGFIAGSPDTSHRDFLWRIADYTKSSVWAVKYRKLPEFPYPAGLDDACQVYRFLLKQCPSGFLGISGDSAGGGLALALVHRLKRERLPLPTALVAISPWTDLCCRGDSITVNRSSDTMVPVHLLQPLADLYRGAGALDDPCISPLYGDFKGFPPALLLASESEVLFDDALRVVERMRHTGVTVEFVSGRKLPHVWPMFSRVLPEGREALESIGSFIDKCA